MNEEDNSALQDVLSLEADVKTDMPPPKPRPPQRRPPVPSGPMTVMPGRGKIPPGPMTVMPGRGKVAGQATIPSGPMTVMPGRGKIPGSVQTSSGPMTVMPGRGHIPGSVQTSSGPMTVMPGRAPAGVPLKATHPMTTLPGSKPAQASTGPRANVASFFAGSCPMQSESQMWADLREQDAKDSMDDVDEDDLMLIDKQGLALAVHIETMTKESTEVIKSNISQNGYKKLAEGILALQENRTLELIVEKVASRVALLELLETLILNCIHIEACCKVFQWAINHEKVSVSDGRILDTKLPIPKHLVRQLSADKIPEHSARQLARSAILSSLRKFPPLREGILLHIYRDIRGYGLGRHTCYDSIGPLLYLVIPFVSGWKTPLKSDHEVLLCDVIAPLFSRTEMLDELTCVMSVYHRPLSLLTRVFMRKLEPERHFKLASAFFRRVLECFQSNNTKHTVLLLDSVQEIMEEIDGEVFDALHTKVLELLVETSSSEHAAIAQRGLQMWKSEAFQMLIKRQAKTFIDGMAPALLRDCSVHWNDGVNNMIFLVLEIMRNLTEDTHQLLADAVSSHIMAVGLASSASEGQEVFDRYCERLNERRQQREAEEKERTELKKQRQEDQRTKILPDTVNSHLNFVWGQELGVGSYSSVKYAKRIERELAQSLWLEYAVKVMNKAHVVEQKYESQVQQEIAVLRRLQHPAISRLFSHFEDSYQIYLVLEYCPKGDLFSAIFESDSVVSEEWFKFCVCEIIGVLNYMHEQGYYYGDLKPENVLLRSSGHICLCDFGSCQTTLELDRIHAKSKDVNGDNRQQWQYFSGTVEYLAPEIFKGDQVTSAADWWALGCVAFQLLAGRLPFNAKTQESLSELIMARTFSYPSSIVEGSPTHSLIDGLLVVNPEERMTYDHLRNHPVFGKMDFDKIFDHPSPPVLSLQRSGNDDVDPRWKRRKFSMMWNPIPVSTSVDSLQASLMDAIPEVGDALTKWDYYDA